MLLDESVVAQAKAYVRRTSPFGFREQAFDVVYRRFVEGPPRTVWIDSGRRVGHSTATALYIANALVQSSDNTVFVAAGGFRATEKLLCLVQEFLPPSLRDSMLLQLTAKSAFGIEIEDLGAHNVFDNFLPSDDILTTIVAGRHAIRFTTAVASADDRRKIAILFDDDNTLIMNDRPE